MIMIPQKAAEDASEICFLNSSMNLYEAFPIDFFTSYEEKDELMSIVSPITDLMLAQACYTLPYIFISWIQSAWEKLWERTRDDVAAQNLLRAAKKMSVVRFIEARPEELCCVDEPCDSSKEQPIYSLWRSSITCMAESFSRQIVIKMQCEAPSLYEATLKSIRQSFDNSPAKPNVPLESPCETLLEIAFETALTRSLLPVAEIHNPVYFKSPKLLEFLFECDVTVEDILETKDMTENGDFMKSLANKATAFWSQSELHQYKIKLKK